MAMTCPGTLSEPTAGALECSRGLGCLVGDLFRTLHSGDRSVEQAIRDAHADREPPAFITEP
jgi:hypothetical protein